MSEEIKGQQAEENEAAAQAATSDGGGKPIEDLQAQIEALSQKLGEVTGESIKRKERLREQQAELERIEQEKLAAEGKKDELIEKLQKQIADMKGELEPAKEQAQAWVDYQTKQKEELIGKLPEEMREKYTDMEPRLVLQVVPDILAQVEAKTASNPDQQKQTLKRQPKDLSDLSPEELIAIGRGK